MTVIWSNYQKDEGYILVNNKVLSPEAVTSVMLVKTVILLEAVALSKMLIISEPADSTTDSGGCLSNIIFTVPTTFYQMIKSYSE